MPGHWLEAEAAIGPAKLKIEAEIRAAHDAIARHMDVRPLDILIQRVPGFPGIPEIGMVGHAYRSGCFSITVAPDNPNFAASLETGHVRVTAAHEFNHCMRMGAAALGRTLGDALVSEGLAAAFCRHVLGTGPMPWNAAIDRATLRRLFPSDETLASTEYDHAAWFFGREPSRHPRWLGYSMGHAIVDAWSRAQPRTAMELVTTPTADILAPVAKMFRTDRADASSEA